jgi:hypothetical protein
VVTSLVVIVCVRALLRALLCVTENSLVAISTGAVTETPDAASTVSRSRLAMDERSVSILRWMNEVSVSANSQSNRAE